MPRSNTSTQKKIKEEKTPDKKQMPPPAPQISKKIPPPAPQISSQTRSNSVGSGFLDSMVSGFGMGLGNSLARKIFEPLTPNPKPTLTSISTPDDIFKKYQECLEHNDPSVNCEMLLDLK